MPSSSPQAIVTVGDRQPGRDHGTGHAPIIDRLRALARARGLEQLDARLADMAAWVGADLARFRSVLADVAGGPSFAERGGRHLLDLEGKYLRPLCLLLAARAGKPEPAHSAALAVAVELVHSATLLHDDVVDLGSRRRGEATARLVFGNAASIFSGDWLLVEALRQIRSTGYIDLLDYALEVIDEMIRAETVQLEHRGRLLDSPEIYLDVIRGKTAALFGWAASAGGRAGGLAESECARLRDYGVHLGVAFQILDDTLDFCGPATGKDLLADLREGKSTYPLLWATTNDPTLATEVRGWLASGQPITADQIAKVRASLDATGALEASRRLAAKHTEAALGSLSALTGPAGRALASLAEAALHRDT